MYLYIDMSHQKEREGGERESRTVPTSEAINQRFSIGPGSTLLDTETDKGGIIAAVDIFL